MRPPAGALLVGAGLCLIVLGLLVWTGALGWFGRLPGDVRVERGSVRVYAPIVSMLLLSLLVSIVLYAVRRWM